jgi:hypothetical protein
MILLLDIGNTRIKWAQMLDGELTPQQSILHRDVAQRSGRGSFSRALPAGPTARFNVGGPDMLAAIRREAERSGRCRRKLRPRPLQLQASQTLTRSHHPMAWTGG